MEETTKKCGKRKPRTHNLINILRQIVKILICQAFCDMLYWMKFHSSVDNRPKFDESIRITEEP